MQFSVMKRRVQSGAIGIDLSNASIKVLALGGDRRAPIITHFGQVALPANAFKPNSQELDPTTVGQVLEHLLTSLGLAGRHVMAAVPRSGTISTVLRIPSDLSESDQEDQVQAEAPAHIPFPINEVQLDFSDLPGDDLDATTKPVLMVAARRTIVDERITVLETAGLTVDMIGIESQAIEAVMQRQMPKAGAAMVVDIGAGHTMLYLLENNRVVMEQEIPFGAQGVFTDLRHRGVAAEEVLSALHTGKLPDGFEEEILHPFREQIAQEIGRVVRRMANDRKTTTIDRIVLGGGGGLIPGIAGLVQDTMGIPTSIGDPLAGWKASPAARAARVNENSPSLWVLTGLALWGLENCATDGTAVNFMPWRDARRAKRNREFAIQCGMAAAAGLAVVAALTTALHGQMAEQQARNQYLQQQIVSVDRQIKEIHHARAERDALLARKAIVDSLQDKRTQMVHIWADLAIARPPGMMLTSVSQGTKDLIITGRAESEAVVSAYLRHLARTSWINRPNLQIIKATPPAPAAPKGAPDVNLPYTFTVKVALHNPDAPAPASSTPPPVAH